MRRYAVMLLWAVAAGARAETIGSVDTVFKLIGPDHKIVVEAYDDPQVNGEQLAWGPRAQKTARCRSS